MKKDITPQDISPKNLLDDYVVKYHFEDYNTHKREYVRTLVKENIYKEK